MAQYQCLVCCDTKLAVSRLPEGGVDEGAVLRDCPVCVLKEINVVTKDEQIAELERRLAALQSPKVEGLDKAGIAVADLGPAPPKSAHMAVLDAFGQSLLRAGKERVGKEVNAQLVAGVKMIAGDRLPSGPLTDMLLPLVTPMAVLYLANVLGQSNSQYLPAGAVGALEKVGTYALQGVTQEGVDAAVDKALPMLSQVMAMASGLPELPDSGQPEIIEGTVDS